MQIRIRPGDGLATDCSNGADTTPATSQLPSALCRARWGCRLPKLPHAKDGGEQPRPPRCDGTIPAALSRMVAPPNWTGTHPAKRKAPVPSPGRCEHGAPQLTWPRQGKFPNFPSREHSSIGRSGRCLSPDSPPRRLHQHGTSRQASCPQTPLPFPKTHRDMMLRVSLRVISALRFAFWLISFVS